MSEINPGDFEKHLIETTLNEAGVSSWIRKFIPGSKANVSVTDLASTFTSETGLQLTPETLDAITKFTNSRDRSAALLTPAHVEKLKPTFAREYVNIFLDSIESMSDTEFNQLRMKVANRLGVP